MKKLFILLSLTLALAGSASAATYTDTNPADVRLDANWLLNPLYNPSYTGVFTLADYDSSLEEIISAQITFLLFDSPILGFGESYLVKLAVGDIVQTGGNFAGFVDFDYELPWGGTALLNLSDTGTLAYTVTATSGSFWLKEASITAESAPRVGQSVPENGTTFALMGAALLGLGAVRRKVRA